MAKTRSFKSLSDFAKFLDKVAVDYAKYETAALKHLGEFLEHDAKSRIGHLQEGGGFAFPDWPELAYDTKVDKMRQGYVFNGDFNPLYRTGELRDSISYTVSPHMLHLGSTSEIMVYQELGTMRDGQEHIPPRPVLGLTMYKSKIHIEKTLFNMLYLWMTQQNPIFPTINKGVLSL